jgi:hypothetical protein
VVTGQVKDNSALTGKTMADAIEPHQGQMAKSFRIAI